MIHWILYALALSLLISVAAFGADRAARLYRRSTRWIWSVALVLSLGLPVVLPRLIGGDETPTVLDAALTEASSSTTRSVVEPQLDSRFSWTLPEIGPAGRRILTTLWVGLSLLTSGTILLSTLRIRRKRREWETETVEARPVRISADFGPAVVGLKAPEIVFPRWMLDLDRSLVRLALLHETEHLSARDTRRLAMGLAPVLLAPWNPLLWWQLRQLRNAIEFDCDRRVLRRGVSPLSYGRALLEMGCRMQSVPPPSTALAEHSSLLERRIQMITQAVPGGRGRRASIAVGIAVAGIVAACELPTPPEPLSATADDVVGLALEGVEDSPMIVLDGVVLAAESVSEFGFGEGRGVARPGMMSYLESRDREIESVEVIKGGDAVRLYGSRAENGVVVISSRPVDAFEVDAFELERSEDESGEFVVSRIDESSVNRPLYVVDGVILHPSTGGVTDIEALDIESVEVMKGEAAREAYGSRAAAGVIIITTKSEPVKLFPAEPEAIELEPAELKSIEIEPASGRTPALDMRIDSARIIFPTQRVDVDLSHLTLADVRLRVELPRVLTGGLESS